MGDAPTCIRVFMTEGGSGVEISDTRRDQTGIKNGGEFQYGRAGSIRYSLCL